MEELGPLIKEFGPTGMLIFGLMALARWAGPRIDMLIGALKEYFASTAATHEKMSEGQSQMRALIQQQITGSGANHAIKMEKLETIEEGIGHVKQGLAQVHTGVEEIRKAVKAEPCPPIR
jgi:hypothetical protein